MSKAANHQLRQKLIARRASVVSMVLGLGVLLVSVAPPASAQPTSQAPDSSGPRALFPTQDSLGSFSESVVTPQNIPHKFGHLDFRKELSEQFNLTSIFESLTSFIKKERQELASLQKKQRQELKNFFSGNGGKVDHSRQQGHGSSHAKSESSSGHSGGPPGKH